MSANKEAKVQLVAEMKEKIQKAKSFVVVKFNGITVDKDTSLRRALKKENVEYHVYKNRLVALALTELGYTFDAKLLEGTNSFAMSFEDETAGPRVIKNFMKEKGNEEILSFNFGVVNGGVVDKAYVEKIASLPSKEALIGQLLSVLNGPMRGVCVALNAVAERG